MRTPDPNAEEAKAAAEAIGYPVALKGISPDITHKTETGLVKLNIADAAGLQRAWDELDQSMNLHHSDARREGMIRPRHGDRRRRGNHRRGQPRSGLRDRRSSSDSAASSSSCCATSRWNWPRSPPQGRRRWINRLQAAKLRQGFRGKQPADVAALEETLVRLGRMAHALGERLVSLNLNPLMVLPEGQGVRIVDIVMQARPSGDSPSQAPSVTLEK